MKLDDELRCMIGAYYGVKSMDSYDIKEYILKDIEKYIRDFISVNAIKNFNYEDEVLYIRDNVSLISKLQDSLIILSRINAPLELILLVRKKIKRLKNENELKCTL